MPRTRNGVKAERLNQSNQDDVEMSDDTFVTRTADGLPVWGYKTPSAGTDTFLFISQSSV